MYKFSASLFLLLFILIACNDQIQKQYSDNSFQKSYAEYLTSFTSDQIIELEQIKAIETFTAKTITNKDIKFGKNSDKPTVLLFFTTWCPTCKLAMAQIDSAFGQKTHLNANIIAIGREHTVEELSIWSQKSNYKLDVVADPDSKIFNKFAHKFVPRIYIIDTKGNVIFQDYGWGDQIINLTKLALEEQ